MQVEERWPCPRCGNRRTLNWARGRYHCFNCRHQWHASSSARLVEPDALDAAAVFTPEELARLSIYRAAVRAGFYTDSVFALT